MRSFPSSKALWRAAGMISGMGFFTLGYRFIASAEPGLAKAERLAAECEHMHEDAHQKYIQVDAFLESCCYYVLGTLCFAAGAVILSIWFSVLFDPLIQGVGFLLNE